MNKPVTTPLPSEYTARVPQQARGRERFEGILTASEALLLEKGIDGFSIPELASVLKCTRTSIYHFFPTPFAILNELTSRYLSRLEAEVQAVSVGFENRPWRDVINHVSEVVSRFHNSNPVGAMLILGAVATSESHQALQLTISHLGRYVDNLMRQIGVVLPDDEPNATALTVELGTSCLRLSYYLHGKVTEAYQRECGRAMISYLEQFAK